MSSISEQLSEATAAAKSRLAANLTSSTEIEEYLAERITSQINDRTMKEANLGRDHSCVMGLAVNVDYNNPAGLNVLLPERLIGKAKIVFQYCVDEGLKPELQAWNDNDGKLGGFNIVVHWGDE